MADQVETTGKTVEEAVKLALLELNATLDEVDIKIVDSGTPGHLLGLGAREAQVRVSRRDSPYVGDDEEEKAELPAPPREPAPRREPGPRRVRRPRREPRSRPADSAEPPVERDAPTAEPSAAEPSAADRAAPATRRDETSAQPPDAADEPESEIDLEDVAGTAHEFIQGLVDRMGFDADVERTGDDPISFNVVGDDSDELASLIGENGETLRAFGFLVNSMLGRVARSSIRIIIDVDGYRKRREEELRDYALDIAEDVRDADEPITLAAMPAYERRMIHMALADADDVRTYSIGEGRERRVVVGPAV
ncbi:MAG TPA: RNA-binding cell elongation regulator Jag/EloR [Chloroflexota bacterium]|nr:RNA-binding cell elongation regulator Jag/EloR [Chloroflexota bacterium]